MNSCIIIGGANATTIQLMRCAKGCFNKILVLLVLSQENSFSYAIKKRYPQSKIVSLNSEKEVVAFLKKKEYESKIVVFTSLDSIVEILDCNYNELSKKYIISNISETQGELFLHTDKLLMSSIAAKCGFSVPTELTPSNVIDSDFPCIIKPKHSALGGKSISICRNMNEYISAMKSYSEREIPISVQHFIDKDYELCFTGCVLPRTKQIVIPGVIRKIRESCGCTSFAKFECNAKKYECYQTILKLLNDINFIGLFSVEVLCKGNQFYFLEINFRADANILSCTHAGCNLLSAFCNDLSVTKEKTFFSTKDFFCMDERTDFWKVRLGEISFYQWLKDYLKTDCRYLMFSKDKRVFFFMLLYAIKQKITSLLRKHNS